MADALGMSLDDLIQQKKASKPKFQKKKPQQSQQTQKQQQQKPMLQTAADKLVVSNLAPSVTQNDVRELFKRIGPVREAVLNYDSHGKSKGVANVTFIKPGDAHKAYTEYHNRPLDERPMKIELIINPESAKIKQLLQPKAHSATQGHSVGKKRDNPKKKQPKKPLTEMDLDMEMDTYMQVNIFN